MARLRAVEAAPEYRWEVAVDRFLSGRELASGTRRVYALTLARVGHELGDQVLPDVTGQDLSRALTAAYPQASPASWNRHVATVRSFLAWSARQGWVAPNLGDGLERRREVVDHGRALSRDHIESILTSKAISVRDRCLFRMLYETAARANEVLRLNVEDLDQPRKRATSVRKGGDPDVLHWQTSTARLLPHVVAGRTRGPLYLAERAPAQTRAPAAADLDQASGRARLSYRRAAEIFKGASGGATLHQLRHSAISHLAEDGVPLPLLMAKSRHESLRTLQRYARPSTEAVAALTAAHDPARRR